MTHHPTGHHTIDVGQFGLQVVVRPVGLVEFDGWLARGGPFVAEHIPELIDALREAHRIASRPEPWTAAV